MSEWIGRSGAMALTGACNILVQGFLVKRVVAWIGEWGSMIAGITFGGLGFAIYGLAPTTVAVTFPINLEADGDVVEFLIDDLTVSRLDAPAGEAR